jgi:hypothetical protein
MQEATKDLPVQELDIPSQYLKLQVKTDGRSYNGKEPAMNSPGVGGFPKAVALQRTAEAAYQRAATADLRATTQQPAAPVPVDVQPTAATR